MLARNLIVNELKAAEPGHLHYLLNFFDNVCYRPGAITAIVKHGDFTEGAAVRASAAGLNRHGFDHVPIQLQQLMAGARQVFEIVQFIRTVCLLELAIPPILQQSSPHQVGLALGRGC